MGLPKINIVFSTKASTAVTRSALGHVALILRDTTVSLLTGSITYKDITSVVKTDWSEDNYDLISKAFLGTPQKVTVYKIGDEDEILPVLKKLENIGFNYLAIPHAKELEKPDIASWIKPLRVKGKVLGKVVLANHKGDDVSILNFTTGKIKTADKTYTADQYTVRMAGILAGLPMTRSGTYYVLPEVIEIEEKEDPDAAIDEGELILINDGEKIKIGRAVNSLTTVDEGKSDDWKKIKIIDTHDLIHNDIRTTFEDQYVGKVNNIYDNQVLFITAINAYYKALEEEGALDNRAENMVYVDVEAQRLAWESIGVSTESLDDQQVKEKSFGSKIFLRGQVKPVDALEDMDFKILV